MTEKPRNFRPARPSSEEAERSQKPAFNYSDSRNHDVQHALEQQNKFGSQNRYLASEVDLQDQNDEMYTRQEAADLYDDDVLERNCSARVHPFNCTGTIY